MLNVKAEVEGKSMGIEVNAERHPFLRHSGILEKMSFAE
jgi:hypothetical protein